MGYQFDMPKSHLVKFDCFKAYEESTKYRCGADTIILRTVYHYATLIYKASGTLPVQSVDGNYYTIPDPILAEIGDIYLERTEINIEDPLLKNQYEERLAQMPIMEFENMLRFDKFELSIYQVMYGKGTSRTYMPGLR